MFRFHHFAGSRLHVGLTGSVAAYKMLDLCRDLLEANIWLSACLTEAGSRFVTVDALRALGVNPVYESMFQDPDHPFPHLEPAQEADALVIAPATANFLAKMACGLANDLLSCQVLAFSGPIVVAPAMNPAMWDAVVTQDNVATLRRRGIEVLEPDCGDVACGDTGRGRLPPVGEVGYHVLRALAPKDMRGQSVLVTLGPTREHLDPVRYWSNPSTGKMGAAVASAAWIRGADVHCVCGPCDPDLPAGVRRTFVQTAQQMHDACVELWPGMDTACLCAAVCDFRPSRPQGEKLKKEHLSNGEWTVSFVPNPDILHTLGQRKSPAQRLVGFAAETCAHLEPEARAKLRRKNLDLIVANRVGCENSGFASEANSVFFLDTADRSHDLENWSKADIAWHLWDWILHN